ncbi:hypothetical protein M9H77_13189 [Catharanthus roseus]|uniref:Uncharacterized protein n=1 Tax=Catharanthus roseus TaxID=4058 RepID=A0ACC0BJL3_CATRO|nr:hypothetical protein M9H77_13189 [Catharanthus roseus]
MAMELTSFGSLPDLKKIELPQPCQPLRLTVLIWLHTRLVQHGCLFGCFFADRILLTLVVLKSYFAFAAPAPEPKRKIIFWLTGRRRKGVSIG